MASTFSSSGLELIATGEKSGTWGTITNTNLQIINRICNGYGTIALSGTSHTLSISDGSLADGHYGVLNFAGSPSGTNTVAISPNDASQVYFVKNSSGQSVILSQASGTGSNVTVANGELAIVFCDGAGTNASVVDMGSAYLRPANNLSDLASAVTALVNLGVTSTAAQLNYNAVTTLGLTEASKTVTADATGVVTFDNGIIEEMETVSSSSNATAFNCQLSTNFETVLTEATTLSFTNPTGSGRVSSFTLKIKQDSGGNNYAVTFPAAVDWSDATAPTLTSIANAVDIFVFFTSDGGTIWYGFVAGQAMG
jgi:hypothetical protein